MRLFDHGDQVTHKAIILLSCSLFILGSGDLWSEERIDALSSELAHVLGEGTASVPDSVCDGRETIS